MPQPPQGTSASLSVTLLYTSLLTFAGGIFVGTLAPLTLATLLWLILIALGLALIYRRQGKSHWGVAVVSLGLIFFVLGGVRVDLQMNSVGLSPLAASLGTTITLEGVVSKEPTLSGASKQLMIRAGDDTILVTTERTSPVAYGDSVQVTGKLTAPEPFTTDLGRSFNYPGYLLARDVEYRLSFAEVTIQASEGGYPLIHYLLAFKHALMENIEAVLPEPAAGLGEGLLLGVKQALGDELEAAFRESGIIHIVVLSGYNIMLVVAFVTYCLSFLLPPRPRLIVGILAIIAFALLVGLSATVVRASIMASLLLIAQTFGRSYIVLRGLVLAGAVMLLFNPLLLVYDVGFQLSFMATLGLILVAPYLETWLTAAPRLVSVKTFLIATVATQIAVLPLLLYQIGQFSVVAVVVNVLALPLVPVAMLLTFIVGMVGFISLPLAAVLSLPAYASLMYIVWVAEWFAALPFASFVVPAFPFAVVPVSYLAIGALIYRYRHLLPEDDFLSRTDVSDTAAVSSKSIQGTDWTIEEEFDEPQREGELSKSKRTATQRAAVPREDKNLPIFFR